MNLDEFGIQLLHMKKYIIIIWSYVYFALNRGSRVLSFPAIMNIVSIQSTAETSLQ